METKKINEFLYQYQYLNSAQQKAVTNTRGPLLVIAGAGSGKTRVITTRIIYLLMHEHVDPRSIIALTFTNKAAGEMKERIDQVVHTDVKPFIGTFHGYCLQILKNHAHLLANPHFTILDAHDQIQLLNTIIKKSGMQRLSAKQIAYQISIYKNSMNTKKAENIFFDPLLQEVYISYEREKQLSKCLDFDDLLLEVLKLFTKYAPFQHKHQQQVRHILIDEYQDTNETQHALIKVMTLDHNKFAIDSLCAVGDEDQSIYSWRGATISNMLHFTGDFADTQIIKIEQNYRCAQSILDAANHIIKKNTQRNPKKLWSTKKATDRIRIMCCMSGYQEGQVIAQIAKQNYMHRNDFSIAVLYRAHYQSRAIEEALIRQSIAYTIIGGIEFYERKEIKDMLAYLRLVTNPFDKISFFRIINCPPRGLGNKFQELVYTIWQKQPLYSFKECIQLVFEQKLVGGVKKSALQDFINLFSEKEVSNSSQTMLERFISSTNYMAYLHNNFERDEAETKIENIKELLRATEHFANNGVTTIEQFLQEVALIQNHKLEEKEEQPTITLMTIHAAKGLEFDMVIIAGLEEGIFPNARSIVDSEMLEEERRLLYVAITRAKEYVLITYAKYRNTYGSTTDQVPSCFLKEIPQKIAAVIDATYWPQEKFSFFFADWLESKIVKKVQVYTVNSSRENTA